MKTRILLVIIIFVFISCESHKKEFDFTFYKFNIRESFYLKYNSSDTLYYINIYPSEEKTSYTILTKAEKEKIEIILDTITFPKQKEFRNRFIDCGQTFAFYLRKGDDFKKLQIHGGSGPSIFWLFGKSLEDIKKQHIFTKMNKKIHLNKIEKMFEVPTPPIIEK